MSWFGSKVVEIKLETHPNAEKLSIVKLTDPFECTVVVQTEEWKDKSTAIYIMPDSIVPDTKQFAFLGDKKRVKPIKLRGILSYGLLIPALPHHKVGDEVHEELGITKYEELVKVGNYGEEIKAPEGGVKYTDIQNVRKYHHEFHLGEKVVITEKIHGAQARYLWQDDKLHIGTHRRWIDDSTITHWHTVIDDANLKIIQKYPNYVFMGEVYGYVQDIRYGCDPGKHKVVFYDIFSIEQGEYYDKWECFEILEDLHLPIVPVLYWGPWLGIDSHRHLAEGPSLLCPEVIREGFVVTPLCEKWSEKIQGRKILKLHGDDYLTRKE